STVISETDRSRVDEIVGAVERAASLTQQLLAFGRRQISSPRVVDMNDVVRRMTPMLVRLIPAPIQLSTRLDAVPATVLIDPSQLEQVLMNLVSNATHAMPNGGALMISTDAIELDSSYAAAHAAVVAGRYVLVTVSDTGVGMNEETMRQIFEPFFTTKEAGHGSGLGLASVYAIVRGVDGYIWPYSEAGKGSSFKIYFPQSTARIAPPPEAVSRERTEDDATILLVEDDAKLRPAVARLLEQAGYRVLQAANGDAALATLASRSASIDLVLTDLVMPGLSGRELSERIIAEFPGIPILFTSGYTDDIVIRQGMIERGHPFIQKPFTRDQLIAAVTGALTAT
ncbi:MAG TPA: response regulator, partial [Gemmatimonadaceae bacterium]